MECQWDQSINKQLKRLAKLSRIGEIKLGLAVTKSADEDNSIVKIGADIARKINSPIIYHFSF